MATKTGKVTSKDFYSALDEVCEKQNIQKEVIYTLIERAMESALKKQNYVMVKFDEEKKTFKAQTYKLVVENEEFKDPAKEISLSDAKKLKKTYQPGDKVLGEVINPKELGRIAMQSARQVIMSDIVKIENENTKRIIESLTGTIVRTVVTRVDDGKDDKKDNRRDDGYENKDKYAKDDKKDDKYGKCTNYYVRLDGDMIEGQLADYDKIPNETIRPGQNIIVYVKGYKEIKKVGIIAQVTRKGTEIIKKLFQESIPEIARGEVEIVDVMRDAGTKTKISVRANSKSYDAVGVCVGNKSSRINAIMKDLNSSTGSKEKIDVVEYSEDKETYIMNAMTPAKPLKVELNEEGTGYYVYVDSDKLSQALGKSGANVKLAGKLTGAKIEVKSVEKPLVNEEEEEDIVVSKPEPEEKTRNLDNLFGDDDDDENYEFNYDELEKDEFNYDETDKDEDGYEDDDEDGDKYDVSKLFSDEE